MTEETLINPHTRKGKVRAVVDQIISDAIKAGKSEASSARAAVFIAAKKSVFGGAILANM